MWYDSNDLSELTSKNEILSGMTVRSILSDSPDSVSVKDLDPLIDPPSAEQSCRFWLWVGSLSPKAAEVVKLALSYPPDLAKEIKGRNSGGPETIKRFLRKRNWSHPAINKAFKEIREGLRREI